MTHHTTPPRFGRTLTAMATPFTPGGLVDHAEAARLAIYLVEHGNDGLVVAGSTGESVTLSSDEKIALFQTVHQAVGARAKVLGGVGSPSTMETVALIQRASEVALDGLLVVTPAYNKPSQEGLFRHFSACAEATKLPIMLYNVPGRTMVNLEPATTLRLAETANIVALKEAGALLQVGEVTAHAPADFDIYCGADEYNLPALALGAVGTISVIGHVVGDDLHAMHEAFFGGDIGEARRLHLKTLPMTRAMFSVPNPVPTKTALEILGVLRSSRVRLPLIDASDAERAAIKTALMDYGLLPI